MNDYGGLDETGKSYSVLPTARRTMRPRAGLRSDVLPRKGAGGGTVQAGAVTAAVTGSDFLISNAGRVKVICLSHKVFVYFTANPKIRAVLLPGQNARQVLREIPVLVEKPHCDDAAKQHSAHMKAQSEPKASGVA